MTPKTTSASFLESFGSPLAHFGLMMSLERSWAKSHDLRVSKIIDSRSQEFVRPYLGGCLSLRKFYGGSLRVRDGVLRAGWSFGVSDGFCGGQPGVPAGSLTWASGKPRSTWEIPVHHSWVQFESPALIIVQGRLESPDVICNRSLSRFPKCPFPISLSVQKDLLSFGKVKRPWILLGGFTRCINASWTIIES